VIRINLLPVREARRKAQVRDQLMLLGATLAASLVLAIGAQQYVRAQIRGAQRRTVALQQELAQYKPQQEQVEAFKKKKAEIQQKLDVIERLDRSRSGPVHILDELAMRTPERVWLTKLNADNGRIELDGMSLDNELVALFLTKLNDSAYFSNVELKATELKKVDALKLNTFRIMAQLQTPGAPAAPRGAAPAKPGTPGGRAAARPAAAHPSAVRQPAGKES
jgi:type IV pilus assembly protein PilN